MDLEIQLPLELTPGPSEGHFAKRQDVIRTGGTHRYGVIKLGF